MAASLTDLVCTVDLKVKLNDSNGGVSFGDVIAQLAASLSLTEGTTANKADRIMVNKGAANAGLPIISGANVDLDMFDMANWSPTTDPTRNVVTLAEVVAVLILNLSTSAGDLIVGGNGTGAAWQAPFAADDTFKVTVRPGGFLMLAAPNDPAYAVADTTNHLLRLAASAGNVNYQIAALGRSA